MKKRLLSLILATVMLLCAVPTAIFAGDPNPVGQTIYVVEAGYTGPETATYTSLADAFNAAQAGDTVKLLTDVAIGEFSIKDNVNLTADATKTITVTDVEAGGSAVSIGANCNISNIKFVFKEINGADAAAFDAYKPFTMSNCEVVLDESITKKGYCSYVFDMGNSTTGTGNTGNVTIENCTFADFIKNREDPISSVWMTWVVGYNVGRDGITDAKFVFKNNHVVGNWDNAIDQLTGCYEVVGNDVELNGSEVADFAFGITILPNANSTAQYNSVIKDNTLKTWNENAALVRYLPSGADSVVLYDNMKPSVSNNTIADGGKGVVYSLGILRDSNPVVSVVGKEPFGDEPYTTARHTAKGFAPWDGVAKIETVTDDVKRVDYYSTLDGALAGAKDGDTVTLLSDVAYAANGTGLFNITKSITLDGAGYKLSGWGNRADKKTTLAINNGGSTPVDVTLKNLEISNAGEGGRPIETRGNINSLTIENCTISAIGGGNTQVLTIGGSQSTNAKVIIKDSTFNAGSGGYPIITFNPVKMDIRNSKIQGFCGLYLKGEDGSAGSYGSVVTASNTSFDAPNIYGGDSNDFGVFVLDTDDVDITLTDCRINAEVLGTAMQAVVQEGRDYDPKEEKPYSITIQGVDSDIKGMILQGGNLSGGAIKIKEGKFLLNTSPSGLGITSEEAFDIDNDGLSFFILKEGSAQIGISGGYYNIDPSNTIGSRTGNGRNYLASGYRSVALSDDESVDGYDKNYTELKSQGYNYKVVLLNAPTEETKYIVTYDESGQDSQQTEYHKTQDAALEAAKESKQLATITVSEGAITADIDDRVVIVAKAGESNNVQADPGYEKHESINTTEGTITYTAAPLEIGYENTAKTVTGSGITETKQTDAKVLTPSVDVTTTVQAIAEKVSEQAETTTVIQTVASEVAIKISQGTAAKALAQGTDLVIKNAPEAETEIAAKDVSVFVDTYYQTKVTEDKTEETSSNAQSFTLDIKPMYQAYATTLVITDTTTMSAITPTIGTSSAAIGSPKELDMTGKIVTMKVKLPEGFVSSTSDKVYVMHTKDGQSPKYYTATVVEDSGSFFAVFTNPDGFSEFTFSHVSLEPQPEPTDDGGGGGYTPVVKDKVCPQDETCVYAKFTDADTKAWYHDGVHYCVEKGYMNGVASDLFVPSGTLSRAMIVTMIWRLDGSKVPHKKMTFTDVPSGQWYTDAIRWAQETKVVNGYSDEVFGPNENVTREQLAAILMRYAQYKGHDVSARSTLEGYKDVKQISKWALDSIKWANAVGMVEGRTTTTIVPLGSSTRAEAACMLQRFCKTVRGTK